MKLLRNSGVSFRRVLAPYCVINTRRYRPWREVPVSAFIHWQGLYCKWKPLTKISSRNSSAHMHNYLLLFLFPFFQTEYLRSTSTFMCICVLACLSRHLSVCLCWSVPLSSCIDLCVYLYISLSLPFSVYLSICCLSILSIHPSLSIYLSIYLSISTYPSIHTCRYFFVCLC
jgi:hypothetical protein